MSNEEAKNLDEKLNKLARGIAMHLEILQGQIGDRLDQIDKCYSDKFLQVNSLLDGKVSSK